MLVSPVAKIDIFDWTMTLNKSFTLYCLTDDQIPAGSNAV